jgi:hypothetical protein
VEPLGEGTLSVILAVIVRTMTFFAILPMLAFLLLKERWVVLLLLPAVGELTLILIGAALLIRLDESAGAPVRTHLARVLEY